METHIIQLAPGANSGTVFRFTKVRAHGGATSPKSNGAAVAAGRLCCAGARA